MARRLPVQSKSGILSSSSAPVAGSSISSMSSSSQTSAKPDDGQQTRLGPTAASQSKGSLYRVIYPYKPQQSDELPLTVGDILTVSMQCDDGWFVGQSTLSGDYGTFPGNYVQPIS